MKAIAVFLGVYCVGLAQTQSTSAATAIGTCNAPNSGNNSSVTVTCYGVDKKLADQISQLVAASKHDGKTLKQISDKIQEILDVINHGPTSGSVAQSNSGGISVQQGTTGSNSPIINSPITVGNLPKSIQPADMDNLKTFFLTATSKIKVRVIADQFSGPPNSLPDDFYDALKGGKWPMVDAGVSHVMAFASPGRPFQGAVLTMKGEPLAPNETVRLEPADPAFYIETALQALHIRVSMDRLSTFEDGLIQIRFAGGFPQ